MKTHLPEQYSHLYIAGVGASAGGLEALNELLSSLPSELGNLAIIIAQHLSPTYKSQLVHLLKKETSLEVVEASNDSSIEAGKIYVTPPDSLIQIQNGKIVLSKPPSGAGPKPSVDSFFYSLAHEKQDKAIGIILSGTGSDGAMGIKAIKLANGTTIVQDPRSARYDGMPKAAIETGQVNCIVTLDKIWPEISARLNVHTHRDTSVGESDTNPDIKQLLRLLSMRNGTDFAHYKTVTIYRRIENRIASLNLADMPAYLSYIKDNPAELDELYDNLLVSLSSFFRDAAAFEELEKLLAGILTSRKKGEAIRIWSAGCATGEEAYTTAILLHRLLKGAISEYNIQIFATDIDEKAIAFARKGIYPASALEHLPDDLIQEFFIPRGDEYELNKPIRSMVLFTRHNLTSNPPFLRQDLIICRNLLIYFNNTLQQSIIPLLHHALVAGGLLFLGMSETIGRFSDSFDTVDGKNKIFRKKESKSLNNYKFTIAKNPTSKNSFSPIHKQELRLADMLKETFYNTFEHPYVVINDLLDMQQVNGDVRFYLSFNQGLINANIIKQSHPDLQIELRATINKAIKERTQARSSLKKLENYGSRQYVRIVVKPLMYAPAGQDLYVVIFEKPETDLLKLQSTPPAGLEVDDKSRILELEQELAATKEHLQSFVEELETANEELQSMNEELQSANEELQSANEEMETANEELQTTNEELQIAYNQLRISNDRLQTKDKQLKESEANLKALLNNTLQSFILADTNFKIMAFNQKAVDNKKLYHNKTLSYGASLIDLIAPGILSDYINKANKCLLGVQSTAEFTFLDIHNQPLWFRYNFTPIFNSQGQVEAISVSSLNITDEKNYLLSHEKSENLINSVFNATETGICVTDDHGRFVKVNEGYARIYGYQEHELIGQSFCIVVMPEQRTFAEKLHADFIGGIEELPGEWQVVKKDGTPIDIYASAKLLVNPDGTRYKVTTVRDITETKKYKNLLIDTQETAKVGGWEYDLINHELSWTEEVYKIYGLPAGEAVDVDLMLANFVDEGRQALKDAIDQAIDQGKAYDLELQFQNQKNKTLWIRTTCKPIRVYNKTVKLFGTFQDVTTHKHAEQEIKKLSLVASKTSNGVIITDKHGRVEWVNEGFEKMSGYTLEEMRDKSPGLLLHGAETDPSAKENMNSQIRARRNFSEDVLNYRKDGTPYWVNINFTPVFNHKNELTHYIAIETDITERKQKEQQLSFQATILENVRDSVIVTDLDGIIIYWNEGAETIFGYTQAEMLNQHMSKLNPGFDSRGFIERHLSGNNPYSSGKEWQGTHKSGQLLWVNVKTNPMYNANGEITGIIGVSTDITAKKMAEEQLRKTEVSLKAMFDTSPNAHFLLSKEYKILSFNKVASEYIKHIWQKEVSIGDSMLEYSNPADLEDFKVNFQKCLNGQLIHFEKRILYPNGMDIWHEILYMPVVGIGGEIEAVSFSSMNITSRKYAEQQLKESNKALADFQYAITSASIVSITDKSGNITYANDNFIKISKFSREELLGQNHRILNSGHHPNSFFTELWRTIISGKIWRGEIKNKSKDGNFYWVDTFIIPFIDEKGKPVQYLSIRNDITNRKLTEETLIRQNTELEKTNTELDRFVYSASHNLRAPLTSIMGLINIINSGEKPELYLAMMEKSVKKLDEFIKDIVNYSKNSRLEVSSEEIRFEELIQSTVEDLRFMKDADKIEVKIDISGSDEFYSDQQRIKVILGNLLSNAFKYHDISQPTPFVQVSVKLDPTEARLCVADNGAGISAEHHQKLFSMFYRATTRSEGSGLGLYIVKEVVEKLGGSIGFHSAPGQGTSFEIILPNLKQEPQ